MGNRDGARFWSRLSKKYARMPVSDEETYREKLRRTQAVLSPQMRVLEFGCGTGSTALEHAPHVAHVLATDIAEGMIAIAREKGAGVGNVEFRVADLDDVAAEGPFDAVLGLNVLHVMADPKSAIAKVHGMLKPGGVFVSSTMCLMDGMALFRLIARPARAIGLFPPLSFFPATDLLAWHEEAGFTIEENWLPGPRKGRFVIARRG